MKGEIWDDISVEAKDLITSLLVQEPEKRISAENAIVHPWFEKAITDEINKVAAGEALNNLRNFKADEKLKQATVTYIASQLLSKKEKDSLGSIFQKIDTNGDGKLSHEEIKNGYQLIFGDDLNEDQVMDMFRAVDIDNSGFIEYSEFIIACTSEKNLFSEKKLKAAFKMYDKDSSGYISKYEIKSALENYASFTDVQLEEIIRQVDKNQDGEISFEEFKQIMIKLP